MQKRASVCVCVCVCVSMSTDLSNDVNSPLHWTTFIFSCHSYEPHQRMICAQAPAERLYEDPTLALSTSPLLSSIIQGLRLTPGHLRELCFGLNTMNPTKKKKHTYTRNPHTTSMNLTTVFCLWLIPYRAPSSHDSAAGPDWGGSGIHCQG